MAESAATSEYQHNQILTAGRSQLLLLVYDGALRFLNLARARMGARDLEGQHHNIIRAQAILVELISSLDPAVDPALAASLGRVYAYLYDRLTYANVHDDERALGEVIRHLGQLREAWAQAAACVGAQQAAPA
jgi:flagellar protein FliS